MSVALQFEQSNRVVIRVSGELQVDEFARVSDQLVASLDQVLPTEILILLEQFEGWEHSDGWEGQLFSDSFDQHVRRIAIVGDPRWQEQALLFTGQGLRPVEIEFFPAVDEYKARHWLSQGV
ncbi:STAS/SEC14 domain-containing protein [Motiliproteus sp.]|uniref:STAS/SEC14 domain-containing protein n=1 Tax=Motiliproteus sp. TaxID=1898955 RepID=UPI003BAC5994